MVNQAEESLLILHQPLVPGKYLVDFLTLASIPPGMASRNGVEEEGGGMEGAGQSTERRTVRVGEGPIRASTTHFSSVATYTNDRTLLSTDPRQSCSFFHFRAPFEPQAG